MTPPLVKLFRTGVLILCISLVALLAYVIIATAWVLATTPVSELALAQGQLLLAALLFVIQLLLVGAAGATAWATLKTVGEMKAAREQDAELATQQRAATERERIREDAWRLIGESHATIASAGAIRSALSEATVFGRVRRSVEGPLIEFAMASMARVPIVTTTASRLSDTPGPWVVPAQGLRDLVLNATAQQGANADLQAYAAEAGELTEQLRDALKHLDRSASPHAEIHPLAAKPG